MEKLTGNEWAYPQGEITLSGTVITKGGLTIRQEFSARFLEGIIAAKQGTSSVNREFVDTAVKYADLLIEELNK